MAKNHSFIPLFLIVFIDMLGVGVLIPVLAPLFLGDTFFASTYPMAMRTFLLGVLIATYPAMQFFGSPMLGAISDQVGRKKVLLVSLFGTFIGYVLFGVGILTHTLWLLFLSRALDGFTGGNVSTVFSAIADISDEKAKAKNFGMIGMAFGLGFILGPFIGGKLADPSIVSWFDFATPFWATAGLTLINMALVACLFKETLKTPAKTRITPLTGMRNIIRAFSLRNVRSVLLMLFFLSFGFNFFTQFFQVYMIDVFGASQSQIGNLFGYIGLWIVISQGVIVRLLSKRVSPQRALMVAPLGLSIALAFILVPSNFRTLLFVLPFVAVFNGITGPNSMAVLSSLAGKESQGEIMGISQSIQSVGMIIPPIVSGVIVNIHYWLPITVGSASVFIAWIVFIEFFNRKKTELFHEV